MIKDILKLKYVLSGNKKFVANYNKHDWTLHTIHTVPKVRMERVMNESIQDWVSTEIINLHQL